MPRARNAVAKLRSKRRLRHRAKGFVGGRRVLQRQVIETVNKANHYATRDRRVRKRDFRQLWIVRINAAVRERGLRYSEFMSALKKSGVALDRKQLSELAVRDAAAFDAIVAKARAAIA